MSNYPVMLEKVINFITEVRNQFPDVKDTDLEDNGEIFYMNGNDGTDFDWEVNDRLCEFGIGVADGSVYAFKCLVNRDGSAEVYCYPHGESSPVKTVKNLNLLSDDEARDLYKIMLRVADDKELWDKKLKELF